MTSPPSASACRKNSSIANVAAKVPQDGAFGRLLAKIDSELNAPVFVENITTRAIAEGLVRKYGFSYVNDVGTDFCFCLFREALGG